MAHDTTWFGGRSEMGLAKDGTVLEASMWLDPEAGIVAVTAHAVGEGDLGALLRGACAEPAVGPPRRPGRVRVATTALAAEIERAALGIRIEVAPTPELGALFEEFLTALDGDGGEAPSPVNLFGRPRGSASPSERARAQTAGAKFFAAAPWRRVAEMELVRVSAPALGLPAGAALITGQAGENYAFALFEDEAHALAHLDAVTSLREDAPPPESMPSRYLLFDVEPSRRKAKPPTVLVLHVPRAGRPFVADSEEHRVATAVAEALARFDRARPVTHDRVTVSLSAPPVEPIDALPPWAAPPAAAWPPAPTGRASAPAPAKRDRNDPCWCGSGKKYKKCHLDADAASPRGGAPPTPVRSRWHATNAAMYERLVAWVDARWPGWIDPKATASPIASPALRPSHAIFVLPAPGGPFATLGEAFRAEAGPGLSKDERRWLDANIATAWTSYWSVTAIDPGRTITLRDLFTGEVRTVAEARASQTIAKHELVCGRVVTIGDEAYLDMPHGQTLGPREAKSLRESVAAHLGWPKQKPVAVEALRKPKAALALLTAWDDAVEARHAAQMHVLTHTTEGHLMVFTTDRYALAAPRAEVVAGLEGLDGLRPTEVGHDTWVIARNLGPTAGRFGDATVLGRLALADGELTFETTSVERADALRAELGQRLGAALRWSERTLQTLDDVARDHKDRPSVASTTVRPLPAAEVQAAVLEVKARAYATWADEPLPALEGRTAREAARTAKGRRDLQALLDEMELLEQREPAGLRFDFGPLRASLGLGPGA